MQTNRRQAEAHSIAVIKLGGSVLTSPASYQRAATFVAQRLAANPTENLVAVVSAQNGETDALQREAQTVWADADEAALDLLWSTGELRSVAHLCLHLQAQGVHAAPFDVRQTGLRIAKRGAEISKAVFDSSVIRGALLHRRVVVVPGFLATDTAGNIVTLGRGGSDLTAVVIAAGLGASRCELIKDVSGYFSADPHHCSGAKPLPLLSFTEALVMASAGCELVQRDALEAAERWDLPLLIRSLDQRAAGTWVTRTHDSEVSAASGMPILANSRNQQIVAQNFSKIQSVNEN